MVVHVDGEGTVLRRYGPRALVKARDMGPRQEVAQVLGRLKRRRTSGYAHEDTLAVAVAGASLASSRRNLAAEDRFLVGHLHTPQAEDLAACKNQVQKAVARLQEVSPPHTRGFR